MTYLIVKCTELSDQWECDADRIPICMTDDKMKYWEVGYEIYKLETNNTFIRIKHYSESRGIKNRRH